MILSVMQLVFYKGNATATLARRLHISSELNSITSLCCTTGHFQTR